MGETFDLLEESVAIAAFDRFENLYVQTPALLV